MELLPKWNLHNNRPTFYDTDAVTMLELAAKMHGAMNELIADYNDFKDAIDEIISKFIEDQNADREAFEVALRQEFQDFIDVIEMKYSAQEQIIDNKIAQCRKEVDAFIAEINSAIDTVLATNY